mgnify:CR=1 FL=1
MVYLQTGDASQVQSNYQPILRTDDQLLIQVGGADMEALAPFQFYYSTQQNQMNGIQGMQALQGITYLIDINGNINFPVLGFVKVTGLTRLQAIELLQKQFWDIEYKHRELCEFKKQQEKLMLKIIGKSIVMKDQIILHHLQ